MFVSETTLTKHTVSGRHPSYMGVKCSKKAERNLDSGRPPSPVTGAAANGALASVESFPSNTAAVVFLFPAPPPSSFAAAPRGLPRRLLVEYWQVPPARSHRWQGSSPLHLHLRQRQAVATASDTAAAKICYREHDVHMPCTNEYSALGCASRYLLLLFLGILLSAVDSHFFFQHASHDDLRRERAKGSSSPSTAG